MTEDYDREKVIDYMFDPTTSAILAELEDGEKSSSYIAEKCDISENEIDSILNYLIEHKFIDKKLQDGKYAYSANVEKLAEIIEDNKNFDAAIDGLTKLDGYLN